MNGYFLSNIVCGAVILAAFGLHKLIKKPKPCDSCKHLIKKGGGPWRYTCGRRGDLFTDTFDKPPKYCKYWTGRNGRTDGDA